MSNIINKTILLVIAIVYSHLVNSTTIDKNSENNYSHEIEEHVLVVHSYGSNSIWNQSIQKGIVNANSYLERPFELHVEYFEGNWLKGKSHTALFSQYLREKYRDIKLKAVVFDDDYAAEIVNQLQDFLADTPVLLLGVSKYENSTSDRALDIDIHYDEYQVAQIVSQLLQTRPDLSEVHFLADRSIVGNHLFNSISTYMRQFLPHVRIIEYRDLSLDQTLQKLDSHTRVNDAVLLGVYNTDLAQGEFYSDHTLGSLVAKYSRAPVYTFWENYITGGVLGGYTISAQSQGALLISKLAQRFDKKYINNTVYSEPKGNAIFDYNALVNHDIFLSQLPSDTTILQRPFISLRDDRNIAIATAFCLLLIGYFSYKYWNKLRFKAQQSKVKKEELQQAFEYQKDMIYVMGEAIESRSGETGNHVKRVAKMSYFLAKKYGLSDSECEVLKIISPMHDIGKISTPESILDKPGSLNKDEFDTMKLHTVNGHKLLSTGSGHLMKMAAIVAHEHHEKWNGSGYPNGKLGESIHIYGRITAVADVIDALLSTRPYKKSWSNLKVMELLRIESGQHFEPKLVDIALEYYIELMEVRNGAEKYNLRS